MASAYWKDLERRHAKRFFDGKRILRGADFSQEAPDGESHSDCWDAKCRQSFAVLTTFRDSEKKYREYTGERRFHVVLHEYAKEGDFVLIRADAYADLVRSEGKLYLLQEITDECSAHRAECCKGLGCK